METGLEVVALTNDIAVATLRQVLICHFRGQTLVSSVEPLKTAVTSILRSRKNVVFFSVIEIESAPPSGEARQALTRFFEENSKTLACAIVVYRGEGFRGAMVRTIVSSVMSLMTRVRFAFPRHVVGSVEEGAALALQASPGLDTSALIRAFQDVNAMKPSAAR